MKLKLALLASVVAGLSSPAHARSEYLDTVLAAIENSNAQAHLYFDKGTYRAIRGDVQMTLEVPANQRALMKFAIVRRNLQRGTLSFQSPVFLTVRKDGSCVRLEIRRIDYENGLPASTSQWTMRPISGVAPALSCNDSEGLINLDSVVGANTDPAAFFKGAVFNSSSAIRKCTTSACTQTTTGQPISRATFFSDGDQQNTLAAFAVSFADGSVIALPERGYLKLAGGSGAQFDALDYYLPRDEGDALLSKFRVTVQDGAITSGSTVLWLAPSTQVALEQIQMKRQGNQFSIARGSVLGELGRGSTVVLSTNQARSSLINVMGARVQLAGLTYLSADGRNELAFARGNFDAQLQSADLWMNELTNIRLGYTNLNLILGCADPALPPNCPGARWTNDAVEVRGLIQAFATQIDGGQFPISNVGSTRIARGRIEADALQLDSTNRVSPITGLIKTVELAFEGDDLLLDRSTRVTAARVDLKSTNLTFTPRESLPIGIISLEGSVTRATAEGIGRVDLTDATAKLKIERRENDEPRISEGELSAKTKMRLEGGSYASGSIDLRDVRYHHGEGNGNLRLSVDEGRYTFTTPGGRKTEGGDLARVEINVKPIDIEVGLRSPFVLGPTRIEAAYSRWSIARVTNSPLRLYLKIPAGELVYAPVRGPVGTICAPKVNLLGQRSSLNAQVDAFASNQGGGVKVHDAEVSEPVQADVDDRGCSEAAGLICGVIGSVAGPIGAAALAMICASRVEEGEAQLEEQIRTRSLELVEDFHYDFTF